jgi:hypothetical protein
LSTQRKSVSDSKLNRLWRQAVLIKWRYTDPISGHRDPTGETLQCHHIIYRRHFVLRWDWRNGVPLTVESHQYVHTGAGAARLRELVNTEYLDIMEHYLKTDWLQLIAKTENEFRLELRDTLEEIIGGRNG